MLDIFSIAATQSSIDRNKLTGESGDIPYVTRTDITNGWDSFIDEQPRYKRDEGNVITIGLDTQSVFYQSIPFYTGQNIQVLRNKHLNKYLAEFLIPLIKIQMQKFNWGGNGATLGRLKRVKIMLPITTKGVPDYEYMTNYMKNIETKLLQRYIDTKLHIISA
ncbi:MAG: restriction endonuclease subunit S [Paludibacteraceae bacterium]|nr:restriction endonuclease subunit S [Paludibacteraceae bacterium]